MKLAIVGSRRLTGEHARIVVADVLDRYRPAVVISGGARGIDTLARLEAERRGIPCRVIEPRRPQWNGAGGFRSRNLEIARACDALVRIACYAATSYGSGWTRDRAREMGKPTEEIVIEATAVADILALEAMRAAEHARQTAQ